jgi:hypothetical protein
MMLRVCNNIANAKKESFMTPSVFNINQCVSSNDVYIKVYASFEPDLYCCERDIELLCVCNVKTRIIMKFFVRFTAVNNLNA